MYTLLTMLFMCGLISTGPTTAEPDTDSAQLLELLDLDRDGVVRPMEAADAIERLTADQRRSGLILNNLNQLMKRIDQEMLDELQTWHEGLDLDGDGHVTLSEIDEEFGPLAATLDVDGDTRLSIDELSAIEDHPIDIFIRMEIELEFKTYGAGDALIIEHVAASDAQFADMLADGDRNHDGRVTREELADIYREYDLPLAFDIDGTRAIAAGTIDISTPGRVMELIFNHPDVDTLVLQECLGSVDDDSNMLACQIIRHHGFTTIVPADGEVASGGVDLFLSGAKRLAEPGARFGVHSWGGVGESGVDMPRDHESHEMYLEFCRDMGIPKAFYWFTLEAADPDDIHWMTRKELDRFNCVTEWVQSPNDDQEMDEFGIRPLDTSKRRLHREGFTKYAEVIAPNGKPIRIIAQPGVRNIAVARARNLLQFFLTDVPGTKYGADKRAVANAMADNRAMLMMPEGHHVEGQEPHLNAQPLFEDEAPVDGSRWYLQSNWDHRDAGFEEIFHLVHDAGIGTYQPGALPAYQRELDLEARASIKDGRWGISIDPYVQDWLEELEEEDSLAQEYIASVIDTYYGLWANFDERPGGMWGIYCAKTRDELDTKDPKGRALLESFLPPMMNGYEALIDPDFEGTFSLTYSQAHPYTHKSRWYVDASLTGSRHSNLTGNDADNTLTGNAGDNLLHGGAGFDVAVFHGPRNEYTIERVEHGVSVQDSHAARDGQDMLIDVEQIRFTDEIIDAP
jgi:Ca2+-binding EF-hand superfamily protein